MTGTGASLIAADALEGARVRGADGVELGAIEEIMLDLARGSVAYAVISCTTLPRQGERLLAIPWGALRADRAQDGFVLDTDRERLGKAPAFSRDRWPPMADAEWAQRLHDFYGVTPYWKATFKCR